jgi:hypothetical protein
MSRTATFSDVIRAAVERDGRPRNAICRAAGIDPAALCRFMHGTVGLSTSSLDKLLPVLGLELQPRSARKR